MFSGAIFTSFVLWGEDTLYYFSGLLMADNAAAHSLELSLPF